MNRTMMKNAVALPLALVASFAMADDLQVTLNSQPVKFEDAQPQMVGGRVLVPLRGVFEQMGATVDWDSVNQTVIANGNGRHVRLKIGDYDASVNGRAVALDVPAQLSGGSTMVPLRFLGEALGARVDWQPQQDLVAITLSTEHHGAPERFDTRQSPPTVVTPPPTTVIIEDRRPPTPPPVVVEAPRPPEPPFVFERDTVIPLRIDQEISSNGNAAGDKFTATVQGDGGRYMNLPDGTVVEGVVRTSTPASGSHGGVFDVRFTHLRMPDGNRYRISGYVTRLDDKNIVRTDNGKFVAKNGADNNLARDAEIGAGAGLILGSTKGKAVGGAVVGGAIGAIVGAFDHHMAHNVILDQGTRLGLVLNRDLSISRHDLHARQ